MGWDGHLKDPKRFRREVLIRRVVEVEGQK